MRAVLTSGLTQAIATYVMWSLFPLYWGMLTHVVMAHRVLWSLVFWGERLRRFQYVAIAFSVVGVLVMTLTYGRIPWIALTLAVIFGFYALLRKFVDLGAQTALLIETRFTVLPFTIGCAQ